METMQENAYQRDKSVDLLDLMIVLLKRKRLIAGGTLGSILLGAVLSFVLTPIYEATLRIAPPTDSLSSFSTQLMGQLGGATSLLLGSPLASNTGDLYVGLLKTDAVLDPIVDQFQLPQLLEVDTKQEARQILAEEIAYIQSDPRSGIISVTIGDESPQRAAEMANAFFDQLKNLLNRLAITEAGKRRLFFEDQIKTALEQLTHAEVALQAFQESSGVLKLDNQAEAMLAGIASLKAQVTAREVQLQVMKTYATDSNPDLKRIEEELRALQEQLRSLEDGDRERAPQVMIPTGSIPNLGAEYVRRTREFKYREMLYELLIKQYEAARLEEAKDPALVQLIHPAGVPEKKVKYKLKMMAILGFAVGIFLFTFMAFFLEYLENASRDARNAERFAVVRTCLKKI